VVPGAINLDADDVDNDGIGDYDAMALGRVVRRVRQEAGLTQERLAEACDMHVTHLSLIERGRTRPTFEKIWAIARYVGLRPSALVAMVETETSALHR